MKRYVVGVYIMASETNEVLFGNGENEFDGIIDAVEENNSANVKKVKEIILEEYGNISLETIKKYYFDGEMVISNPYILETSLMTYEFKD